MSNLLTPAEVAEIKRRAEKALPPDWQEKMRPGHWFTFRDEFGNPERDENGRPKRGWCDDPACATNKERAKLFGPHRDILRLLADREVLVGALRRVANHDPDKCEGINQGWDCVESMREVAKSVLAQVEGRET